MTSTPDTESRPRARRYAEAISAAAAADTRVTELTERLTEAEWHRSHAEEVVDTLLTRLDLADQQVINSLDDEPGEDVGALISLTDGKAWVRDRTRYFGTGPHEGTTYWLRAEASQRAAMRYEWPIEGGPFLALPDDWHLRRQVDIARQRDETEDELHRIMREEKGYPRTSAWTRPSLIEALHGVQAHQRDRWLEVAHERDDARQRLAEIRRLVTEPYDQLEVEMPDAKLERVDVARVDAVLAILNRESGS